MGICRAKIHWGCAGATAGGSAGLLQGVQRATSWGLQGYCMFSRGSAGLLCGGLGLLHGGPHVWVG